jgi:hypothetical protein
MERDDFKETQLKIYINESQKGRYMHRPLIFEEYQGVEMKLVMEHND